MPHKFVPGIQSPADPSPSMWLLFQGNRLLVRQENGHTSIPTKTFPEEVALDISRRHYLGSFNNDGTDYYCFCGEISEGAEPPLGYSFESLRPLYAQLDEHSFWLAGLAIQIVDWDRTHQYCGRCGQSTKNHEHERSKICTACGFTHYPRLSPAVIVRVQRQEESGPEILLARATRFPNGMFSVLAGFVEPGETLEDCVRREVLEETGISVHAIKYFGSQPWPFPNSLMIAFTAEYQSGYLEIDPAEIAEAGWYSANSMPAFPPPPSIANRLIVNWLAGGLAG